MDIVSDPSFWASAGLAAAARLAVLATALWIVRLAIRGWTPRRPTERRTARVPAAPQHRAQVTMTRPPETPADEPRYVDLRTTRSKPPVTAANRVEDAARRERLQNRLMEYLDQRAMERKQS